MSSNVDHVCSSLDACLSDLESLVTRRSAVTPTTTACRRKSAHERDPDVQSSKDGTSTLQSVQEDASDCSSGVSVFTSRRMSIWPWCNSVGSTDS